MSFLRQETRCICSSGHLSVWKNVKRPILVYWIVPGSDLEIIAPYSKHFAQSDFHISVVAADDSIFANWKENISIPRAAYLRLLVPDLLSHQKALYLDTDTRVVSDITQLLEVDIGNNLFAGVPDPVAVGRRIG